MLVSAPFSFAESVNSNSINPFVSQEAQGSISSATLRQLNDVSNSLDFVNMKIEDLTVQVSELQAREPEKKEGIDDYIPEGSESGPPEDIILETPYKSAVVIGSLNGVCMVRVVSHSDYESISSMTDIECKEIKKTTREVSQAPTPVTK